MIVHFMETILHIFYFFKKNLHLENFFDDVKQHDDVGIITKAVYLCNIKCII